MRGKVLVLILACLIVSFAVRLAQSGTIVRIISPSDNDIFSPGDKVLIKLEAPEKSTVLISTEFGDSVTLTNSPYELNFTIPPDAALGKFSIRALAADKKGISIGTAEININVGLSGNSGDSGKEMKEMSVYPENSPFYLWYRSDAAERAKVMVPITVYATFGDGLKREITSRESGTQYVSSDESVFIVDFVYGKIVVRPVNIGEAYLTITHGSFSKKLQIIVRSH